MASYKSEHPLPLGQWYCAYIGMVGRLFFDLDALFSAVEVCNRLSRLDFRIIDDRLTRAPTALEMSRTLAWRKGVQHARLA
jgi:hypothetical protein